MKLSTGQKFQAFLYSFVGCAAFWLVMSAGPAVAQGVKEFMMRLQDTTPGTAQTGHTHITGTSKAGQFVGGGAGVTDLNADNITSGTIAPGRLPSITAFLVGAQTFTGAKTFSTAPVFTSATVPFSVNSSNVVANLNADKLDGFDASSFLQTVPNPLSLNGSNPGSHTIKGENSSTADDSTGVHGVYSGTNGYGSAGFFENLSLSGIGVEISTVGYGLHVTKTGGHPVAAAYFQSTGGLSPCVAVSSEGAIAIDASAVNNYNSVYAGRFTVSSDIGRGVFGLNLTTDPFHTPYGVYGQASATTLGYGVYANGDMGASGVKSFRIDHPFDPENKYLLHYSSESPFPQNFYNGNVVTDAQGYAWVELPEYFSAINTNFKYQLTVVEDDESPTFVHAKIGRKIAGNRFLIMTSAPNVEVSWRIEADRNDHRIKFNRPTDSRQKGEGERGTYQHPEYFGLGPERGIHYASEEKGAQLRKREGSRKR